MKIWSKNHVLSTYIDTPQASANDYECLVWPPKLKPRLKLMM